VSRLGERVDSLERVAALLAAAQVDQHFLHRHARGSARRGE